jgi:hypothetical protein
MYEFGGYGVGIPVVAEGRRRQGWSQHSPHSGIYMGPTVSARCRFIDATDLRQQLCAAYFARDDLVGFCSNYYKLNK